jgi:WD40 repeat protein
MLFMNPVELVHRSDHLEALTGWDTATGKLVSSIPVPQGSILTDFVLSPGRMLLAYENRTDYKEVVLHESVPPFARVTPVSTIEAPGVAMFDSVRFSADGTRLAIASHHAQPLRIYAVPEGRLIAQLDKAYYGVLTDTFPGFVFSPDGQLLAVSHSGGTASIWSIGSAEELCTLEGQRYGGMHALVFGPDGKTLISRDSHALVVWDISDLVKTPQ